LIPARIFLPLQWWPDAPRNLTGSHRVARCVLVAANAAIHWELLNSMMDSLEVITENMLSLE